MFSVIPDWRKNEECSSPPVTITQNKYSEIFLIHEGTISSHLEVKNNPNAPSLIKIQRKKSTVYMKKKKNCQVQLCQRIDFAICAFEKREKIYRSRYISQSESVLSETIEFFFFSSFVRDLTTTLAAHLTHLYYWRCKHKRVGFRTNPTSFRIDAQVIGQCTTGNTILHVVFI